jgi:hypothetical protein
VSLNKEVQKRQGPICKQTTKAAKVNIAMSQREKINNFVESREYLLVKKVNWKLFWV